jgi:hypothetical protein
MQKKGLAVWVAAIIVISVLAGLIAFKPSEQNTQTPLQNIVIKPDGSISPADAPIMRVDNVYTFTGDIYGTIKIQKSNIVLNGAGYTLRGPYNGSQANVWVVGDGPNQSSNLIEEYIIGLDFNKNIEGTMVQNLNVKNFSIGMYVWTENNTVTGSSVSDSIVGILLSGQNNSITYNYIEDNKQGLFMGFNNEGNTTIPPDIIIHHNDFENNDVQLNGCNCLALNSSETPHHWDDGSQGNYWSDYNGTDTNGDGIGDSSYMVDALNIDRYPLIMSPYQARAIALTPTFDPVILAFAFAFLALATYLIVVLLRKRKH